MVRAVMDLRLAEAQSRTETSLLRQQYEPHRHSSLRPIGWLLSHLGCYMVTWGKGLERYGLSQAQPLETGVTGN
jgi:hypothetical protein